MTEIPFLSVFALVYLSVGVGVALGILLLTVLPGVETDLDAAPWASRLGTALLLVVIWPVKVNEWWDVLRRSGRP